MAVSIVQQPTSPNAAYTRLPYVLSGSDVTQPQFQYVLTVVEAGVAEPFSYTLTQTPNEAGAGVFDVSRILQGELGQDENWNVVGVESPTNTVKEVLLLPGEQYGTSESSSVEIFYDIPNPIPRLTVFPAVVDTTINNFNFDLSKVSGPGANYNPYLTNNPATLQVNGVSSGDGYPSVVNSADYETITIFEDTFLTPASITFYAGKIENGNYTAVYNDNITLTPPSGSFNTIGIGPQNLGKQFPVFKQLLDSGAINFVYTANDSGIYTQIINDKWDGTPFDNGNISTKNVTKQCTDDYVRFAFINRYGFWDYYNVYNPVRRSSDIQRENVTLPQMDYSNNTSPYSHTKRGEKTYYTEVKDRFVVDTEYLDKTMSDWLEELMDSPSVYVQRGECFIPVFITNSTYNTNNSTSRNKLFQYNIEFEPANQPYGDWDQIPSSCGEGLVYWTWNYTLNSGSTNQEWGSFGLLDNLVYPEPPYVIDTLPTTLTPGQSWSKTGSFDSANTDGDPFYVSTAAFALPDTLAWSGSMTTTMNITVNGQSHGSLTNVGYTVNVTPGARVGANIILSPKITKFDKGDEIVVNVEQTLINNNTEPVPDSYYYTLQRCSDSATGFRTNQETGSIALSNNDRVTSNGETYIVTGNATTGIDAGIVTDTGLTGCADTDPAVTTLNPNPVTTTSITFIGDVTNVGDPAYTEKGFVYVQGTGTPTTADNKIIVAGTGLGTYNANETGLTPGTQYTVRAYIINTAGTFYGGSVTTITNVVAYYSLIRCSDSVSGFLSGQTVEQISLASNDRVTAGGVTYIVQGTSNTGTSVGTVTDTGLTGCPSETPRTYNLEECDGIVTTTANYTSDSQLANGQSWFYLDRCWTITSVTTYDSNAPTMNTIYNSCVDCNNANPPEITYYYTLQKCTDASTGWITGQATTEITLSNNDRVSAGGEFYTVIGQAETGVSVGTVVDENNTGCPFVPPPTYYREYRNLAACPDSVEGAGIVRNISNSDNIFPTYITVAQDGPECLYSYAPGSSTGAIDLQDPNVTIFLTCEDCFTPPEYYILEECISGNQNQRTSTTVGNPTYEAGDRVTNTGGNTTYIIQGTTTNANLASVTVVDTGLIGCPITCQQIPGVYGSTISAEDASCNPAAKPATAYFNEDTLGASTTVYSDIGCTTARTTDTWYSDQIGLTRFWDASAGTLTTVTFGPCN